MTKLRKSNKQNNKKNNKQSNKRKTKRRQRKKPIRMRTNNDKSNKSNKRKTKKIIYYGGKKFKKESCAPKKKGESLSYTCFTPDNLQKLKDLWNKRHPDRPIKGKNSKQIWRNLKYAMDNTCSRETCWINEQMKTGDGDGGNVLENLKKSFAPKQPESWKKKPNTWLNSTDILKVMKQYEDAYDCFEFIGPTPIDFDDHMHDGSCVWEDLCKFDLEKEIRDKKKKIGIIFNLDPHYKGGSHWVAMFINIKKKEVCYFDSYGETPPGRIKNLAKRIVKQSTRLPDDLKEYKNFKFISCTKRHQYSNSECGVYSLYFIIQLLTDQKNSEYFSNNRIRDNFIKKFRNKYFNK